MLDLHCCTEVLSSCGKQGLLQLWCLGCSLQWLLLLPSTDSVTVVQEPSCLRACGIFPDQGSNPCFLAGRFLTTGPPGEPWASLHVLISHPCIFFGEIAFQMLCPFNWAIFLSCKSSLYIVDINPLSDTWFENISHFCGLVFFFLFPWRCPLKHKSFEFWWSSIYLLLWLVLSVSRETTAKSKVMKIYIYASSKSFIVLAFTSRSVMF